VAMWTLLQTVLRRYCIYVMCNVSALLAQFWQIN